MVLVGERPDSKIYVRMKKRALAEAGMASIDHHLPADATEEEIVRIFCTLLSFVSLSSGRAGSPYFCLVLLWLFLEVSLCYCASLLNKRK